MLTTRIHWFVSSLTLSKFKVHTLLHWHMNYWIAWYFKTSWVQINCMGINSNIIFRTWQHFFLESQKKNLNVSTVRLAFQIVPTNCDLSWEIGSNIQPIFGCILLWNCCWLFFILCSCLTHFYTEKLCEFGLIHYKPAWMDCWKW